MVDEVFGTKSLRGILSLAANDLEYLQPYVGLYEYRVRDLVLSNLFEPARRNFSSNNIESMDPGSQSLAMYIENE